MRESGTTPDEQADQDVELDVRAILAEIGAEEAIARLEARLSGLEQELERERTRAAEAERGQRGELDVMRARIEDALELVRESTDEQRQTRTQLDERLTNLIADESERAHAAHQAIRDDLAPRIERAVLHADEVQARLAGEVESVANDVVMRTAAAERSLAEARAGLQAALEGIAERLDEEAGQRETGLTELDARVRARVEESAATQERNHEDTSVRLDSLRRELDAAAGELRATLNLRAGELGETIEGVHEELANAIEQQVEAAAELERRWIAGTREIARRIEDTGAISRAAVEAERDARGESERAILDRVEELAARLEQVDGRAAADASRRAGEAENLQRAVAELGGRVEGLQHRLAGLVGEATHGLGDRLAQVSAEVEALREASVRQAQHLSSLEQAPQRLADLAQRQEELARGLQALQAGRPQADVQDTLSRIRRDLATLAGGVEAAVEQTRSVAVSLATVQEAVREQASLRQEVRDLAARTAEVSARLVETEKLARAAGQAIASAVRRARQADQAARPVPTPLPPAAPDMPTVPSAEQQPLFQRQRPSDGEATGRR